MASQRNSKSPVGAVMASQAHGRTPSELSMASEHKHEDNLMAQLYSQTEGKDLPLRTMYILNCASRGQHPLPSNAKGIEGVPEFTSILQTEMSQLPLQRTSLPYVFVRKFVKETFCQEELGRVNFSQALTALDYLKDIEMRRQKMVQDMWQRVDIETWESIEEKVSRDEAIIRLFNILNRKEKYLGELYAWLYVHLRQWILIHEIKNQPFDKHNCMAMLNTLWPPIPSSVPDGISNEIVQSQRKDFFKTINSIPGRGMADIDRLIVEQAKEGQANGWPCTAHMMNKYMQKADEVIELSESIQTRVDLDTYAPPRTPLPEIPSSPSVEHLPPRKGRKQVDSGVSFGSAMTKRPSTSGSDSSNGSLVIARGSRREEQQNVGKHVSERSSRILSHLLHLLQGAALSQVEHLQSDWIIGLMAEGNATVILSIHVNKKHLWCVARALGPFQCLHGLVLVFRKRVQVKHR
ncbi:hypothetical protein BK809_0006860 [Diplodia seriata]|uniref:Uncharacterized protein n=1 Tax=Diplodia seriata TaxID=420778 RepID=A0A1S8B4Q7_9PEZI|nr:hypothetical protein BK809_0006860 [Diplodia seriata]